MNAIAIHPAEMKRRLRHKLAVAVDRLIAAMDALDGDPDFEPWLGAPEQAPFWWRPGAVWAQGANDDRELDGGEDDDDTILEADGDEEEWCPYDDIFPSWERGRRGQSDESRP